jgi:hypothetical protein
MTEVCNYRLNLRGKPIGSHILSTSQRGRLNFLEAKFTLQGQLGNVVITQRSKSHRVNFHSLSFQEDTAGKGENRSFNVTFDLESGLIKAHKSGNDVATMPYIRPYLDPLGLLYAIRQLAPEQERWRVPMVGKDVVVDRMRTTSLETVLGPRQAYEYQLHPGGSFVYVDVQEPHLILMLSQRIDGQLLDAVLARVDQEADTSQNEQRGRSKQRGRKRRFQRNRND